MIWWNESSKKINNYDITYERIRIFSFSQSGFWESQKRKYYSRRLIRIMIRQYLMVHNYNRGISNSRLISQLNEDFRDTSDSQSREMANASENRELTIRLILQFSFEWNKIFCCSNGGDKRTGNYPKICENWQDVSKMGASINRVPIMGDWNGCRRNCFLIWTSHLFSVLKLFECESVVV